MMRALLLCLPALLSCGTAMPGDEATETTVGSRLTPLYFVGTDGSRVPSMSWFLDKQTGKRCQLTLGPGGPGGPPPAIVCATDGMDPGDPARTALVSFTLQP